MCDGGALIKEVQGGCLVLTTTWSTGRVVNPQQKPSLPVPYFVCPHSDVFSVHNYAHYMKPSALFNQLGFVLCEEIYRHPPQSVCLLQWPEGLRWGHGMFLDHAYDYLF